MNPALLQDYDTILAPHLPQLKERLEAKLRGPIEHAKLMIHSLEGRVKSRPSVEKKLARPDRSYRQLWEVTDLVALRVITYSEDVIADVARLIEKTFDVDFENSTNKLHQEDAHRFGYRSLHYVCSLPVEVKRLLPDSVAPLKFEIQIRTILQHTWAQIEHEIGYKGAEQLPRELRRRFSQIASLLEVADREFAAIRADLKTYEALLQSSDLSDGKIELDRLSLRSLVAKADIEKWDAEVAQFLGVPVTDDLFYPDYILRVLRASGLKRLGDVLRSSQQRHGSLSSFLPAYFAFADKHWGLQKESIPVVQKGYGLLFLSHLQVIESEDLFIDKVERLTRFFAEVDYPDDLPSAKRAAQSFLTSLTN